MTVSSVVDTSIKGAVVSHLDITPRRRMETRLQEGQDRFLELTVHLRQALWVIDAIDRAVLYISPGYEKLWGRACQSLIDRPRSYLEGIHPLDEQMMRRQDATMYQTGHIDAEFRVLRPDGTVAWVWINGHPVPHLGRFERLVGVIEDITDRKNSEEERCVSMILRQFFKRFQ